MAKMYKVTVRTITVSNSEIFVKAKSKKDANSYLKSKDDWKKDMNIIFQDLDRTDTIEIVKVEEHKKRLPRGYQDPWGEE